MHIYSETCTRVAHATPAALNHAELPRRADFDTDNPALNDEYDTWVQFIDQFKAQYADTQKGEQARTHMEDIKMKGMDIDQYIADFIDLANEADYYLEAEGTKCHRRGTVDVKSRVRALSQG
jgi:hypothetical protein